ncbi:hypothetical protein AB7008_15120 [Bradyrhizobium sp. 521_C7_N1_3]|uniref:hypothetical protein n=1 Tax=Bradyrhizobium sp. 521_C7_N1_3 TaxID=3240368 RepID=UPI003F89DFE4
MLNANLIAQERSRQETIATLQRLRREARDEITRLILFLDQSDPYVTTELEEACEDEGGQCEGGGGEEGCEDEGADTSDAEPSLGAIERHPSCYEPDGRNWSGDQTVWAGGGTEDLEDEHDGREPGEDEEPSLGAFEGHHDQDVAWTTNALQAFLDKEQDPSESGIVDHDGLLEQVGTQDWRHGAMA